MAGFSTIEAVLMVAVVSILAATMIPMATEPEVERNSEVTRELKAIQEAMESYYYENGAFPASLTDPTFLGVYLSPGVDGGQIRDPWGNLYVYATTSDGITLRSLGRNGLDDGDLTGGEGGSGYVVEAGGDDLTLAISSEEVGLRRTRDRLRVIAGAINLYGAEKLSSGQSPDLMTGDWSQDLTMLKLGIEFSTDGWGNTLVSETGSLSVYSVGYDGNCLTQDDIKL